MDFRIGDQLGRDGVEFAGTGHAGGVCSPLKNPLL
jgi:hypothetical protein